MQNCKNTFLFGILILIILCFHYKYIDFNYTETFQNPPTNKQINGVADCKNPNFEIKGTPDDGLEYCADINGVMKGCQKFEKNDKRNKFIPFGIFGTYIDSLSSNDVNKCLEQESENLSKWGLCNDELLEEIKGWKYEENDSRLKAIKNACNYYKKGFTKDAKKIQN